MDIKDETLRKMLAGPFGWELKKQNLLESNATENEATTDGKVLTVLDKELSERAAQRLVASEVNKQTNMEDVIQRADKILQKEPKVESTSEESDQGWVEDFLDGAGKAYNDELKDYWAKLLAGEIKNPGKYSKRITNFMKTISQKDAGRIRNMCQYVMRENDEEPVIFRYRNAKYSFSDICFLMELRLIDSSSTIVNKYSFSKDEGFIFYHKNNMGFRIDVKKKEYDLPIYSFTELGKEVLTIIDNVNVNTEYLKEFAKHITDGNNGLKVIGGYYMKHTNSFIKNSHYFEIEKNFDGKGKVLK